MRRALSLGAIGISLWSSVVCGGQSTEALPAAPRALLQNAQFGVVTSVRGLPLTVRGRLEDMWQSRTLDIAEPGGEFRRTGAPADSELPLRRMIAAGCTADNYCLIYYERGGNPSTFHVALFRWTPDATRFEWGGTASGNLKTIEEVRKAILSGAVKAQAGPW
ncbi:MAG TPA: hypothetical protein VM819_07275 [Vicinamibacterales bacterium]|nr:hypothetical protein [Vicinamibacterales bacterium]